MEISKLLNPVFEPSSNQEAVVAEVIDNPSTGPTEVPHKSRTPPAQPQHKPNTSPTQVQHISNASLTHLQCEPGTTPSHLQHKSITSPTHLHHKSSTSPAQVHHISITSPVQAQHNSITTQSQVQHISITSPAQVQHNSITSPAQLQRKTGTPPGQPQRISNTPPTPFQHSSSTMPSRPPPHHDSSIPESIRKKGTMWRCSTCTYESRWKANLTKHERVHTGERPFQCTRCCQRFTQFIHLRRHLASRHSEVSCQCSICEKVFNVAEYIRSADSHSARKPYKCAVCNTSFSEAKILSMHLVAHGMNSKPFKCPDCEI